MHISIRKLVWLLSNNMFDVIKKKMADQIETLVLLLYKQIFFIKKNVTIYCIVLSKKFETIRYELNI